MESCNMKEQSSIKISIFSNLNGTFLFLLIFKKFSTNIYEGKGCEVEGQARSYKKALSWGARVGRTDRKQGCCTVQKAGIASTRTELHDTHLVPAATWDCTFPRPLYGGTLNIHAFMESCIGWRGRRSTWKTRHSAGVVSMIFMRKWKKNSNRFMYMCACMEMWQRSCLYEGKRFHGHVFRGNSGRRGKSNKMFYI